jgi:hypothetical protein
VVSTLFFRHFPNYLNGFVRVGIAGRDRLSRSLTITPVVQLDKPFSTPMANSLAQKIEEKPQVGDQVPFPQPGRFLQEPVEPFQPHPSHEMRRSLPFAAQQVEASADPRAKGHPQPPLILPQKALLWMSVYSHKKDVRTRCIYLFDYALFIPAGF